MLHSGCRTVSRWLIMALFLLTTSLPVSGHAALPGDCDGNGAVAIDEVQAAINMYLGLLQVRACVDLDGSGKADIAEVQAAINSYLGILVPIVTLNPNAAMDGQVLSVSITGMYTDFLQGTTTAGFGPDIAVGGGPSGAAGLVTVTSPTTATALVTIGSSAQTGSRVVTIATNSQQAKALFTVNPSTAASITPFSGTPQSAPVNTAFSAPLVAVVKNAANNPVAGMLVTFAAPANGAGGTFAGGVKTAVTDAAGKATSAVFTANGTVGSYTVTASVAGVAATASFSLNNTTAGTPPASMTLSLSQSVVNGGGSLTFADLYYDAGGALVVPAPVSNCSLTATASTGTPPAISGKTVTTSADTRGSFNLTCLLPSTALTKTVGFSVIAATSPTNGQPGLYGNLSVRLTETSNAMNELATALNNGQLGAVQGILDRLRAARSAVNLNALQRSTPFAPEGGFPPTPAQLTARGFGPGPNDYNFDVVTNNLIYYVEQATIFINGINPLAMTDATGTTLAQLNTNIQTLLNQLKIYTPSLNGVVSSSGNLNKLLSDTIPTYQQALINKVEAALKAYGMAASAGSPQEMYAAMGVMSAEAEGGSHQSPEEFYGSITPAFFGLVDLMMGSSIQGQLINMMYGQAFTYLENTMILLAANSLLGVYVNNLTLEGIITGASLSFHIFNAPGSVIEGSAINPIPSRNDVLLVGPNQVAAVRGLLEAFKPGDMDNLDDVYNYFQGIVDAIQAAGESYDEAHQPPDDVVYGCILSDSGSCREAYYSNGFNSVYTCSGWFCPPAAVIVIIHNLDTGEWAWGLYNFDDG